MSEYLYTLVYCWENDLISFCTLVLVCIYCMEFNNSLFVICVCTFFFLSMSVAVQPELLQPLIDFTTMCSFSSFQQWLADGACNYLACTKVIDKLTTRQQ